MIFGQGIILENEEFLINLTMQKIQIIKLFDNLCFKLFFSVIVGFPLVLMAAFFGVVGISALLLPFISIHHLETLSFSFKVTFFYLSLGLVSTLGILGFIGGLGVVIRIHKSYEKLTSKKLKTIRFMLYCGLYPCVTLEIAMLFWFKLEKWKIVLMSLTLLSLSLFAIAFCIYVTPKNQR